MRGGVRVDVKREGLHVQGRGRRQKRGKDRRRRVESTLKVEHMRY